MWLGSGRVANVNTLKEGGRLANWVGSGLPASAGVGYAGGMCADGFKEGDLLWSWWRSTWQDGQVPLLVVGRSRVISALQAGAPGRSQVGGEGGKCVPPCSAQSVINTEFVKCVIRVIMVQLETARGNNSAPFVQTESFLRYNALFLQR